MSMTETEFLKDAKGILMKNGRFLCLKCFRESPLSPQIRRRHLEARIGHMGGVSHLKDVGVVVSETDLETDDTLYICDKCGEEVRGPGN